MTSSVPKSEVLKLESVRGSARELASGDRVPATLTLTLTVTHVNESRNESRPQEVPKSSVMVNSAEEDEEDGESL